MTTVKELIDDVMRREGWDKYTNHPADRGGPTKWGITQTTARAYGYKGDIRDMTYDQAYSIYYRRFWDVPQFDEIAKRSHELAVSMFDFGVNSGQTRAVVALQRALNSLNRQGKDYPDIAADGLIGPMTLHCLDEYIKRRGVEGKIVLHNLVRAIRSVFLMELTERSPSQEVFNYGWQKRSMT